MAAVSASGCSGDFVDRPRTVVLIAIDTLRADRVHCYGAGLARTPTLDSLATEGIRFEDVTTTAPVTLPAMASILTGLYPFRHGVRDNGFFFLAGGIEALL